MERLNYVLQPVKAEEKLPKTDVLNNTLSEEVICKVERESKDFYAAGRYDFEKKWWRIDAGLKAIWENREVVWYERVELPGATKRHPEGVLEKGDRGELAVRVSKENGKIRLDFGTKLSWVAMTKAEAKGFAEALLKMTL